MTIDPTQQSTTFNSAKMFFSEIYIFQNSPVQPLLPPCAAVVCPATRPSHWPSNSIMDSAAPQEKRGRKCLHMRYSLIARNVCCQNLPPLFAAAAPPPRCCCSCCCPGWVDVGRTTEGRVVRLPLPDWQRGLGSATSTTAVAASATATAATATTSTVSSVEEYLSLVESPQLDSKKPNSSRPCCIKRCSPMSSGYLPKLPSVVEWAKKDLFMVLLETGA